MGNPTPDGEGLGPLLDRLKRIESRLAEVEKPSGTNVAQLVQQVQTELATVDQRIDDGVLARSYSKAQIDAKDTQSVTDGRSGAHSVTTLSATGDVSTTATIRGDAGMTSVGSYSLDVTTLPGGRRTGWVHESGRWGYAPSSRTKKVNIGDFRVPADAFFELAPRVFQYKALFDVRDNPENPNHDPDFTVPTEVGLIAEELIDAGLDAFVFWDKDGSPAGINYDLFAAVGVLVLARDARARERALELRLAAVEKIVSRLVSGLR